MAGSGHRTWTAGETVSASNVQGYLQDQTVMVFATEAARDAALTSPAEGMFAYLETNDELTYYTGSAWLTLFELSGSTGRVYSPATTNNNYLQWNGTDLAIVSGGTRRVIANATVLGLQGNRIRLNDVDNDRSYIQIFNHGASNVSCVIVGWDGTTAQSLVNWQWNSSGGGSIQTGVEEFQADADGTAADCTYTWETDQDTGMYRNASDDARISGGNQWGLAVISGRPYGNLRSATGTTAVSETSNELLSGAASRREWKHHIDDINDALADINKLRPVSFHYHADHIDAQGELGEFRRVRGFIAQDVDEDAPWAVQHGWLREDGWGTIGPDDEQPGLDEAVPLNWDRDHVIATLVAAIQELSAQVAELRAA